MAMLAEPRRRQKYSVDPRGLAWSNDDTKFGQKLMEKMGWQKGKGLGANEDGSIEHVKVSLKNDNRGVGCSANHADNWIAHQDDFNSLLAGLAQDHSANASKEICDEEEMVQVSSLEKKSKSSKSRVHYKKFTKGKDLSRANVVDLDCIFGKRKIKSEPSSSQVQSEANSEAEESNEEEKTVEEEKSHGLVTITSTQSCQEYFAKKMAELKAKRSGQSNNQSEESSTLTSEQSDIVQESDDVIADQSEETSRKKKSKKRKHEETQDKIEDEKQEDVKNEISKKKRKKSKKHKQKSEEILIEVKVKELDQVKGKSTSDIEEHTPKETMKSKKFKKKKCKKEKNCEEEVEKQFIDNDAKNSEITTEKNNDKSSKKKSNKKTSQENDIFKGSNLYEVKGYAADRINGYENFKH